MATAEQAAIYLAALSPSDIAKALRLAAWNLDVAATDMPADAVRQGWKQTAAHMEKSADHIKAIWNADALSTLDLFSH